MRTAEKRTPDKRRSLLLCVCLVIALLCGCAGGKQPEDLQKEAVGDSRGKEENQETWLTFAMYLTNNYTEEFWQHMIDEFEKDNPGIRIKKVLMTGNSRSQFLKTMLAAGNLPDINVDPTSLAKEKGVYAEAPEELLAKFEETLIAANHGVKNLIPASQTYRTQVFYNRKQFEEAGITETPKTWDEFVDVCERLQQAGFVPLMGAGAVDIWATGASWWIGVVNAEIYHAYPDFNQDITEGKVSWSDPVIADALKKWQTLRDYYHKGSMSFSYMQASSEFLNGSAAMFLNEVYLTATIDNSEDYSAGDFGCFVMPTPSGTKTFCTAQAYWAVAESCRNKEAAFRFCEYALGGNEDIYREYLEADGTFSATKEPVTYEYKPCLAEFMSNLEGYSQIPEIMRVAGDYAIPSGFEEFTLKSLQNIFNGADVDEELAAWDAEMERLAEAAGGGN